MLRCEHDQMKLRRAGYGCTLLSQSEDIYTFTTIIWNRSEQDVKGGYDTGGVDAFTTEVMIKKNLQNTKTMQRALRCLRVCCCDRFLVLIALKCSVWAYYILEIWLISQWQCYCRWPLYLMHTARWLHYCQKYASRSGCVRSWPTKQRRFGNINC